MFERLYARTLRAKLKRPYVHVIFGARQTGKSTLIRSMLPADALVLDLADPAQRNPYFADIGRFVSECRALEGRGRVVFVDEAQTVPGIFDAVQSLYDTDPRRWRFVLCGSSARRLRASGSNLLPGRSSLHRLHPLVLSEHPAPETATRRAPSWPQPGSLGATSRPARLARPFPRADLIARLTWGSLPGIVTASEHDRADLLLAYAQIHFEEEVRREATLRNWGAFVRFVRLAAAEAGQLVNYSAIASEVGLSLPTVREHYQLLEDMFVGISVPAWSKSPRKNLLSTPKFLFFDLGVRHAAHGLRPSADLVLANPGPYFEQWVGLELVRRIGYAGVGQLHHLRTRDGAEVDWIVESPRGLTPIEVKWTERPSRSDARNVRRFIEEHATRCQRGLVVCRCQRPAELAPGVLAIPWWCL